MCELEDWPLSITGFVVVSFLAVWFIGCFIWAMIAMSKVEHEQKEFLGACIEFHSIDRCKEFDQYGRRDLGLRH